MLERVRAGLDELEASLWAEADVLGGDIPAWEKFAATASERTVATLDALEASGLGTTPPA